MAKFRKKPVVIEAVQFTGDNCIAVLAFMGSPRHYVANTPTPGRASSDAAPHVIGNGDA
jgi:hypothetical protein